MKSAKKSRACQPGKKEVLNSPFPSNQRQVNASADFCQALSKIKNVMHLLAGHSECWEWSEDFSCFQPITLEHKKAGPIHPKLLTHLQERPPAEERVTQYDLLAWFRAVCTVRMPSKEEELLALRQISSRRMWLCSSNSAGKFSSYEAYAKGTERYNRKQIGHMLDTLKEIGAKDMDCAFLTLTCDHTKYESLADAWESYREKEISPVVENLRKNHAVEYVGVLESTAKGWPHLHILLFFPRGMFPELRKCKNEQVLNFGKLFNYVKSHVTSRVFKIKVVKGGNKIHYLTKYISKGATNGVFKLLDKKGRLSKEDWKLIHETVFLAAFRKRKVIKTRRGCKGKAADLPSSHDAVVFEKAGRSGAPLMASDLGGWESLPAAERRAILNSLCTNSLVSVPRVIRSMSVSEFKERFQRFPERQQEVSDEDLEVWERSGRLLYSSESFYTLFCEFVACPKTARLNRKFWRDYDSNEYSLFTDGYNLNDDEDFLLCCKDLINYYLQECVIKGYWICDVMEGKQGFTNMPKYEHLGNHQFAPIVSEDSSEAYFSYAEWENTTHAAVKALMAYYSNPKSSLKRLGDKKESFFS